MNKTSIIRTALICTAAVAIVAAIEFSPAAPQPDPLAQRLAVCGDIPDTTIETGRALIQIPVDQYNLAVKSVDDCRKLVMSNG